MSLDYEASSSKIKRGHVAAAALTSADAIRNWPKQSDMGWHRWFDPVDVGPDKLYEELPESLGIHATPQGAGSFVLRLPGLTPAMLYYVRNTTFDGNATDDFTVEYWSRLTPGWRIVQCVGFLDGTGDSAEAGFRSGLKYLDLRFVVLQEAP